MWALSDLEINEHFKNDKLYLGTYAKDKLPMVLAKVKRGSCIINMGDAATGGTHWVAILMSRTHSVYFDSFGAPPPQRVLAFMKKRGVKSFYSDRQLQDLKASSCGWYCVMMIEQCVLKGKDILDILPRFTFDAAKNEKILAANFKR
jgi:hypothetical protein